MISLSNDEFALLAEYIRGQSGLSFDYSKHYLLETRLQSLLVQENMRSFSDLIFRAKYDKEGYLRRSIINCVTTGETSFFRDPALWTWLKNEYVPQVCERSQDLSVWCCACSTGQEPWSVAMSLVEGLNRITGLSVLATDINQASLDRAKQGAYTSFEVDRGLGTEYLSKYFHQEKDGFWYVNDTLRKYVDFVSMNLMDSFVKVGKKDLIFCRNVAIYFNEQDRISLFRRLAQCLKPEGLLIIGSTESLHQMDEWERLQTASRLSIYALKV